MLPKTVTFCLALAVGVSAYAAPSQDEQPQTAERAFVQKENRAEAVKSLSPELRKMLESPNAGKASEALKQEFKGLARETGLGMDSYIRDNRQRLIRLTKLVNRSLGINPQKGTLMVFVSHSMSDDFIRSYLHESAWSGAKVYVRGIPKGMNLITYIRKTVGGLIGKKQGAGISINPRKFGMYGITQVPAIVWDEGDPSICKSRSRKTLKDDLGHDEDVMTCEGASSDFYKISGGVTIEYALRQFIKAGATGAQDRLDSLRRNVYHNEKADKVQTAYNQDWDKVKMPGDGIDLYHQVKRNNALEPAEGVLSDTSTVQGK